MVRTCYIDTYIVGTLKNVAIYGKKLGKKQNSISNLFSFITTMNTQKCDIDSMPPPASIE